jgi:hypothetical protein
MPTTPLIEVMFRIETAFLSQHHPDGGLGKIQAPFRFVSMTASPVIFFHPQDEGVTNDAGVVDKEIDPAKSVFVCLTISAAASVFATSACAARARAQRFNLGFKRLGGFGAFA